MKMKRDKRAEWSWIFYDWANSAFATTVMAGLFPVYFKTFLAKGFSVTESTAILGIANAAGSALVAFSSPILGIVSDIGRYKKTFLFIFLVIGVFSTIALLLPGEGEAILGASLYALACVGFAGSIAFYDSLLPAVTTKETIDMVSSMGYAWGYLGGGVLFAFNVLMISHPTWFVAGMTEGMAVRFSFLTVGLWWAVFSIPLFIFVPESEKGARDYSLLFRHIRKGVGELALTVKEVRRYKTPALFLAGFFLYNDAVGTTIKMAVDYGLSIGMDKTDLILALLMVQFIGFPSALIFGKVAQVWHPKTGIYICIGTYIVAIIWAAFMQYGYEFYVLAGLIGIVQGGIQALSRSYFATLIPQSRAGEFFGFYNLLGKFAGLLGPLFIAAFGYMSGSSRIGIASLLILFLAGGLLLSRVKPEAVRS